MPGRHDPMAQNFGLLLSDWQLAREGIFHRHVNNANRITQGGTASTSAAAFYTAPAAVTGPANTAEYSFKDVSATRSDAMAITGSKFNFLGSNSFNNLSLTSTGAVTQVAGSSVVVSGKFAVSASGQTVTLDQSGNRFGSLGDITATSATIYLGGDTQATTLVGNATGEFNATTLYPAG